VRYPEFASCWVKVDRAREHRKELDRMAKAWLDPKPYSFRTEPKPEPGVYVIRFDRVPLVPSDISAIIGDTIHNLRSALDHFVYRLAVIESRADPPPDATKLAFPIGLTEEDFNRKAYHLGKLSEPMRAHIKRLQPFTTHAGNPQGSALWQINELDIIDKHRELTLAVIQLGHEIQIGPATNGPISILGLTPPVPLEADADLLVYSSEPGVYVDFNPTFQVAFAKSYVLPEGCAATDGLAVLAENVETVLGTIQLSRSSV